LARPLTLPNFIALGQTMYEKSVKIFLHHSVFWRPNGIFRFTSLCPDIQQGCLLNCQISSRSDSLSTRYLLPYFVDFVESVTDRPTDNVTDKNGKWYIHAYHAAKKITTTSMGQCILPPRHVLPVSRYDTSKSPH